jgi:hypothetical protein
MNHEVDQIAERMHQEREMHVGNTHGASSNEQEHLDEFSHEASYMLGEFVYHMVEQGAPGAELMPVATEKSRLARLGTTLINAAVSAKRPTRKPLEYTDVPGWHLGRFGTNKYALLATNELIKEQWVGDQTPTIKIAPENYATVLMNCGINDAEALARRLSAIKKQTEKRQVLGSSLEIVNAQREAPQEQAARLRHEIAVIDDELARLREEQQRLEETGDTHS